MLVETSNVSELPAGLASNNLLEQQSASFKNN